MKKLFINMNGNSYYLLFGSKGEPALLLNMNCNQYIVCAILEEASWWQGNYFEDFDKAYEYYKHNYKKSEG